MAYFMGFIKYNLIKKEYNTAFLFIDKQDYKSLTLLGFTSSASALSCCMSGL